MEFENLIRLIQTVSESELTGFRYEEDGVKICLKKESEASRAIQSAAGGNVQGSVLPVVDTQGAFVSGIAAPAPNAAAGDAGEEGGEAASAAADLGGNIVKSPLVGIFYTSPSEDAEPYVSVGDTVKKGQVLATVEAMKLMNEIESEYDGVVEKILVENGQGVGYGEPLFVIR